MQSRWLGKTPHSADCVQEQNACSRNGARRNFVLCGMSVLQLANKKQNNKTKVKSMKLNLDIERLEARIAPGGVSTGGCTDGSKDGGSEGSKGHAKGNNGFGNGGDDGSNAGKQDATR